MQSVHRALARFMRDETGATAIEYGLIGALVAVAIILGAAALGTNLNTMFQSVADQINPPA